MLVLWGARDRDVQVGSVEDRCLFDSLTIVDTGQRFSLTRGQAETLRRFYARRGGSVSLDLRGCPSVKVGER
jgi:hypothetical protein